MEDWIEDKNIILNWSLRLEVDHSSCHTQAFEPYKIKLHAACTNQHVLEAMIGYTWLYSDSRGLEQSFFTFNPTVAFTCPNHFCGRNIELKVRISLPRKLMPENMFLIESPGSDENCIVLEDKKELVLSSEQQMPDEAWWYSRGPENNAEVLAEVVPSGYNGKEIGVKRFILDGEKVVWEKYHTFIVWDNSIPTKFSRYNCGFRQEENKTYTFLLQLVDPVSGYLLAEYRDEVEVYGIYALSQLPVYQAQPVVVGEPNIVENNFKPCKYELVEVEYTVDKEGETTQTVTAFREGFGKLPYVYLTGGRRRATVILKGFTNEDCEETPVHTPRALLYRPEDIASLSKQDLVDLIFNRGPEELPVSVSGETGRIENIELTYNYISDKLLALMWQSVTPFQTTRLEIATCRYKHDIELRVLPDIEWSAYLKIDYLGSQLYTHTNMPAAYGKFEQHQQKAIKAGRDAYYKKFETEVSYSLSATYDDGKETDYTGTIDSSTKLVVDVLAKIKEGLNKLSFNDAVNKNRKDIKAANILPKKSKIALSLDIFNPTLILGGGWQYAVDEANNAGPSGEVFLAAAPLIGARGGIDLIACSEYIPVVGKIIKAVLKLNDFAAWFARKVSGGRTEYENEIWFNLFLEGNLGMKGAYNFSVYQKEAKLEVDASLKFCVEMGLKAEITTRTVTIKGGEVVRKLKAGASAEAKTGVSFIPAMGYDNTDGLFLEMEVKFQGLILEVDGGAKYEEEREGEEKEESEEDQENDGFGNFRSYLLIEKCTLWEGKIYPFKSKENN